MRRVRSVTQYIDKLIVFWSDCVRLICFLVNIRTSFMRLPEAWRSTQVLIKECLIHGQMKMAQWTRLLAINVERQMHGRIGKLWSQLFSCQNTVQSLRQKLMFLKSLATELREEHNSRGIYVNRTELFGCNRKTEKSMCNWKSCKKIADVLYAMASATQMAKNATCKPSKQIDMTHVSAR